MDLEFENSFEELQKDIEKLKEEFERWEESIKHLQERLSDISFKAIMQEELRAGYSITKKYPVPNIEDIRQKKLWKLNRALYKFEQNKRKKRRKKHELF